MPLNRLTALCLTLAMTACAGSSATAPDTTPGHGALAIEINPNPIVATHVRDDVYTFPFDVKVREIGGRPVTITSIQADVYALGGLRVYSEEYDSAKLRGLGFPSSLAANGQATYHFSPQKSVPDERLFGNVSAELTIEAKDDLGVPSTTHTTVTVRR